MTLALPNILTLFAWIIQQLCSPALSTTIEGGCKVTHAFVSPTSCIDRFLQLCFGLKHNHQKVAADRSLLGLSLICELAPNGGSPLLLLPLLLLPPLLLQTTAVARRCRSGCCPQLLKHAAAAATWRLPPPLLAMSSQEQQIREFVPNCAARCLNFRPMPEGAASGRGERRNTLREA